MSLCDCFGPGSIGTEYRRPFTSIVSVFVTDLKEQLACETPLTQFGRACDKLGIEIICANSPQAKGRVERNHGVCQDRLVKEFRLKGISDIESANALLANGFVDKLNAKFAIPPADPKDYHRQVGKTKLEAVFCTEHKRTIGNDFTVRFLGRIFQITKQSSLPPAKAKLVVQTRLDGSIHLVHEGREIEFVEIATKIDPLPAPPTEHTRTYNTPAIPVADHPWRRNWKKKSLVGTPR